jgi:hypothetical protein
MINIMEKNNRKMLIDEHNKEVGAFDNTKDENEVPELNVTGKFKCLLWTF